MLNYLLTIDAQLFYLLNHLPHNFLWDYFFGALTFIGGGGLVWFALTFFLFLKNYARKAMPFEAKKLLAIYAVGIFSLFLIFILKKIFGRLRPEFTLHDVIIPFSIDNSFSFPSGHALASFAFAYLLGNLGKLGRLGKLGLYLLAFLISFSRIYLGYHYPLDIIAGAVIGVLVAKIAIKIINDQLKIENSLWLRGFKNYLNSTFRNR